MVMNQVAIVEVKIPRGYQLISLSLFWISSFECPNLMPAKSCSRSHLLRYCGAGLHFSKIHAPKRTRHKHMQFMFPHMYMIRIPEWLVVSIPFHPELEVQLYGSILFQGGLAGFTQLAEAEFNKQKEEAGEVGQFFCLFRETVGSSPKKLGSTWPWVTFWVRNRNME